jgi:hypothetical protein
MWPLIGVFTVIKVVLLLVSICQYCGPQNCVLLLLSCGQVCYIYILLHIRCELCNIGLF